MQSLFQNAIGGAAMHVGLGRAIHMFGQHSSMPEKYCSTQAAATASSTYWSIHAESQLSCRCMNDYQPFQFISGAFDPIEDVMT